MELNINPFAVKTPESLGAAELVDLFVPYPEYENLQETGHHFLHGHRGSGKSMMLRMMEPECQTLHRACSIDELPYFGTYFSIKATEINQPEFARLEKEPSGFVLSEHVLTTKVLSHLIASVGSNLTKLENAEVLLASTKDFVQQDFVRRLELCGWQDVGIESVQQSSSIDFIFGTLTVLIDQMQANTIRYIKRHAFVSTPLPYDGALLGFQDVLVPIVKALHKHKLIPPCPVFVLIDDADNLSEQQTKVLNTWVSYRSTEVISLKISTQLNYKTLMTSGDVRIEAPHDFSEINFTTVRTGSVRKGYPDLVADIVNRRLVKYGLADIDVRNFFPEDASQAQAIKDIEDELKISWHSNEKGGFRPGDDAYRFARPEYIRRLGGSSRQGATYRYAGFDQLVHISSGIIRFFLDPAAKMFAEELKRRAGARVTMISPDIQDAQIRAQSDDLLLDAFETLHNEVKRDGTVATREIDQLKNLISGLGYLFQAFLMDKDASQRRIFSIHLSDDPPEHLRSILAMAVRYGYLYKDAIGRKEGMGRTTLYVLTRRLAPAFKLDPIGFSNHLSVTSVFLCGLLENPRTFKNRLKGSAVSTDGQMQLALLDQGST
jgi:hypothetical protein